MVIADPRFRREAADAVAKLVAAKDFNELHEAARQEFGRIGCGIVVGCLVHHLPGGTQSVDIIFGDTEHPWIEHYEREGLGAHCPITGSAGPRPVCWDEIKSKPLSTRQRRVFNDLRDFQLFDGQIVTVEGFGATSAVVSVGGRDADYKDPHTRTLSHLLAVNYGVLALSMQQEATGTSAGVRLTERQRECLQWVAEGKTSAEIADILGLSERTVEEHLARACALLGVRSRAQACAVAARIGLLTL